MSESIFTKIINHEIPANIIYEDDTVVAFLDINPVHKGHTLVVPKKPFENIFDADTAVLSHMYAVAKPIAQAIKKATECGGVNLVMNNGAAAGQEVFHAHLHIIPRFTDDAAVSWTHETYAPDEASALATTLTAALAHAHEE